MKTFINISLIMFSLITSVIFFILAFHSDRIYYPWFVLGGIGWLFACSNRCDIVILQLQNSKMEKEIDFKKMRNKFDKVYDRYDK